MIGISLVSLVIGFFLRSLVIGISLRSSVIGSSLGSSMKGSCSGYSVLGSSMIWCSLVSWVLRSSLGFSVLVFRYVVCHQLHQQLEWFFIDFQYFSSNKCFDSFLEKLHVITGYLDKFLTREKSFILDFWLGSETFLQSHLYAEVTLWSSFFWCFLNSYILDYLDFLTAPSLRQELHIYPNMRKKEKDRKK